MNVKLLLYRFQTKVIFFFLISNKFAANIFYSNVPKQQNCFEIYYLLIKKLFLVKNINRYKTLSFYYILYNDNSSV